MAGYTFNAQLYALRLARGLSRKEAAKAIGMSRFRLYLYEKGYFRPRGKALTKLESFYETAIDFAEEKDYPALLREEQNEKKPAFARKKRLIVYGVLAATMAATLSLGTALFVRSTKNDASFYGESYAALYQASRTSGKVGTELLTNATYHYFQAPDDNSGSILFYDSSSFLHFNECNYAATFVFQDQPEIGTVRLHYRFGGDLASDSHRCYFTLGSTDYGTVITCEALYYGEPVETLENFKVDVPGKGHYDEETVRMILNFDLGFAITVFDKIIHAYLGEGVSFMDNFLPDRERGRGVAMSLQVSGLILIALGAVGLFLGLSLLVYSSLRKLHLRHAIEEYATQEKELPKDIHIPVGLPDFLLRLLARILFFASFALVLVSFLTKVGVALPPIFYDATFLSVLRTTFMVMPFMRMLLLWRSRSKGERILIEMARSFVIFFLLAGFETLLIAVTNAWGYDFSELIYDYVPGSVFQVVALLYLILFFLSFTPAFLQGKKKSFHILWRLLSLLPLGLLAGSVLISNAHLLFIDVPKNIFISFWFPSSVLPASIVAVVTIYGLFFLRLFFKKRYGKQSAYYLNGDRFALISNLCVAIAFVLVYLFILALQGNEYAYYLGLNNAEWILTLIPLFLLTKSAPGPCPQADLEASLPSRATP